MQKLLIWILTFLYRLNFELARLLNRRIAFKLHESTKKNFLRTFIANWERDESNQKVIETFIYNIIGGGATLSHDAELTRQLGDAICADRLEGIDHFSMLKDCLAQLPGNRLLDFGAGEANSRADCERIGYDWQGLDIRDSAESKARRGDDHVTLYDGLSIPFAEASFDVVLAVQSLEHIQDANLTFEEIGRILKPGGRFIGSVSYLEPFHSHSTFNFTPYGFKQQLARGGMTLSRIHPGIDAFSLMTRRLMMQTRQAEPLHFLTNTHHESSHHESSLFNRALIATAHAKGVTDIQQINALRLLFAGVFRFEAMKANS